MGSCGKYNKRPQLDLNLKECCGSWFALWRPQPSVLPKNFLILSINQSNRDFAWLQLYLRPLDLSVTQHGFIDTYQWFQDVTSLPLIETTSKCKVYIRDKNKVLLFIFLTMDVNVSACICLYHVLSVSSLSYGCVNINTLPQQSRSGCFKAVPLLVSPFIIYKHSKNSKESALGHTKFQVSPWYFNKRVCLHECVKWDSESKTETDRKVERKALKKTTTQDLQAYSCNMLVCTANWTTNTRLQYFT